MSHLPLGIGIGIAIAISLSPPVALAAPLSSDAPATSSLSIELTNRMAGEDSPYLRRAATHPVAWQPWGREVFETAQRLGRPVFVDLGAMGSHWCGEMDRENYSHPDVATLLNTDFVCVRVDTDARPDIDKRYSRLFRVFFRDQAAGQPLLLFLTPEGHLFFGSSYLPREDAGGRSFPRLLEEVTRLWQARHADIERQARLDTDTFFTLPLQVLTPSAELTSATLAAVQGALAASYNPTFPGFGSSEGPRFPAPWILSFLLGRGAKTDANDLLVIVDGVVDSMIRGAISDPVDGGLFRYSVDGAWMRPRFEKRLDINAAWLWVLALTQKTAPRPELDTEMRRTWSFIQRRLSTNGSRRQGFASGIASDPPDGRPEDYWCFSPADLSAILPETQQRLSAMLWGVSEAEPESAEWTHRIPLHRDLTLEQAQQRMLRIPPRELAAMRDAAINALRNTRESRPSPPLDTRRFTAANARLVQALWHYADVTHDETVRSAALDILSFFESTAQQPDGLMIHQARIERADGEETAPFLEDQAAWLTALLESYQATGDSRWLNRADQLAHATLDVFKDPYGVALTDRPFSGPFDDPTTGPIAMPLFLYEDDGAPGPLSEFALGLAILSNIKADEGLRAEAKRLLQPAVFAARTVRSPYATWARAAETVQSPIRVTIKGNRKDSRWKEFLRDGRSICLPGLAISFQSVDRRTTDKPLDESPGTTSGFPTQAVVSNSRGTSAAVDNPEQLRSQVIEIARRDVSTAESPTRE